MNMVWNFVSSGARCESSFVLIFAKGVLIQSLQVGEPAQRAESLYVVNKSKQLTQLKPYSQLLQKVDLCKES